MKQQLDQLHTELKQLLSRYEKDCDITIKALRLERDSNGIKTINFTYTENKL